jgi:hypothetical protein
MQKGRHRKGKGVSLIKKGRHRKQKEDTECEKEGTESEKVSP